MMKNFLKMCRKNARYNMLPPLHDEEIQGLDEDLRESRLG
jgi:hypothetical protein